jgi:tetratricopeptide (TPR) repeat protein
MKNLLAAIILSGLQISVFSQSNQEIASQKLEKAIEIMDKGNSDVAIELLKEAKQLDPDNFIYDYETGFAYYLKKDLKTAIKIFKQTFDYPNVTDQAYQMAGNLTDESGSPQKALKIYDEGIKKFPNSGRLYLEKGTVYLIQKKYNEALSFYERGIKADPTFPSNYYRAALLYFSSDEKVWAMIYGEMLMNLERNTKRTAEVSKLLYDTYKSQIKIGTDTSYVSFSRNNTIYLDNKNFDIMNLLPFGTTIYEPTLLFALSDEKSIDIHSLNRIRQRFIDFYTEKGFNKTQNKPLFEFQKMVREAGHFDAYNYWILMKGDEEAFISWKNENKEKWESFTQWFTDNSIKSCFEKTHE